MKLFKPQLQLAKELEKLNSGEFKEHYYLHIITVCDRSNYRAKEQDVVVKEEDSQVTIQVDLYFHKDPQIIDLGYLTPIVNTIDLGMPIKVGEKFLLRVDVHKSLPSRDGNGNSSGSNETSSTQADEDARPEDPIVTEDS